MPARKKIVTTEIVDNETPPLTNAELPKEDSLDDNEGIQNYLSQFTDKPFVVKVYKITATGAEFCFKGSTDVDEEMIQNAFGGGRYELRVFVDGLKADVIPVAIAERKYDAPIHNGNGNGNDANSIHNRFLLEQIAFFKTQAMLGNQKGGSLTEMVEALKIMNGIGGSTKDPMEYFFKAFELAKDLNNGGHNGDWKTALIDSAKDIAKAVAPGLIARSQTNNGQPIQISSDDMIRQGITYLKQQAVRGLNPQLVIEWIMSNSNDPQYEPFLKQVLGTEFEQFSELDPELKNEPYRTWFSTVHQGIKDIFNENISDDDSSGTSGNIGNVKSNGGTGSTRGKIK